MRILVVILLLGSWTLPLQAEVREYPRDPDFYFPFDTDKHDSIPVPMPDLTKRAEPTDSRNLSRSFAPDRMGTLRMIGIEDATSTCIGEPVSVLCAVETYMAAFVRRDDHLLEVAQGPFSKGAYFKGALSEPPSRERFVIYRVYHVEPAGPFEQWRAAKWWRADRVGHGTPKWGEGDFLVDILEMECHSKTGKYCNSRLIPVTYAVRQMPMRHWVVVDVYVPRW